MRVLHLITGLETGGAETALLRILGGLEERFENRVVSLVRPGHLGREMVRAGIEVTHLDMRRGVPSPGAFLRLLSELRSFRPDLLQTWLYHADLMGTLAALAARVFFMRRIPVAWNLRCSYMDFSKYSRTTAWTVGALARLSGLPDAVVANSEAALAHHVSLGYHPRRAVVIENGIDCERFAPLEKEAGGRARGELRLRFGIPEAAPLAGLAARFDPMKDIPTLLSALAQTEGLHLLLCGQGMAPENDELAAMLRQSGTGGRVHLAGHQQDMPSVLGALDFVVSSSIGESFPNVVAEAMACGVPAVVTDTGLSRTLVGETGLVVLPGEAEALAGAMAHMAAMPAAERAAMGRAARARILERWSLSSSVRAYETLWTELASA